mgnify:CR=1 FL=1|tara:strand:+ start:23839 stop:25593 length:1755 start_codon:yes stop_codon:yes gene_type:complete
MTYQPNVTLFITVLLCIGICLGCIGQIPEQSYLNTLGDEPLLTLFDKNEGDSIIQEKIARTYLDRARRQKDTIKMARGYDRLARIFHPEKNIAFADSLIEISNNQNHKFYPAIGYFIKARNYKLLDDFNKFFENTKLGYDYAVLLDNLTLQNFSANNLVFYKSIWGDKNQALMLQKKSHKIFNTKKYQQKFLEEARGTKKFNGDSLISINNAISLQNLSHCYLNLKILDSARIYNNQLAKIALKNKTFYSNEFLAWSWVTTMEIDYYEEKYSKVILSGNNLLRNDTIIEKKFYTDVLLFYGLAKYAIGEKEEANRLLQKVDSIFISRGMKDISPYERLAYEKLLDYSRLNNNISKQLEYLGKIILVDSIQKERYSFFDSRMIKDYETPLLLAEREKLINHLKKENQTPDPKLYLTLSALTASLCLLFYYVRKRLVYKKRFEKLLAQRNTKNVVALYENSTSNELSTEVVEEILEKLDRFERHHNYLDSEITLQNLAKKFKTNSNYLSRVINLKLEKNFSQYLHELRITYAVEELFTNTSYRKYTIKAIAEECGYKNAESFSKAFYKMHGIYPSYYLRKLDKNVG